MFLVGPFLKVAQKQAEKGKSDLLYKLDYIIVYNRVSALIGDA